MSCRVHEAYASGDDEAFARALRAEDEVDTLAWAEHEDGECRFCDAVRAEVRRRLELKAALDDGKEQP